MALGGASLIAASATQAGVGASQTTKAAPEEEDKDGTVPSASDTANIISGANTAINALTGTSGQNATTSSGSTNTSNVVNSGSTNTSNTSTQNSGSTNSTTTGPSSSTTYNSGSTNTSQLMLTTGDTTTLEDNILDQANGLAATTSGAHQAGVYNSSTNQLLTDDLLARTSANVAALAAPTVNTIGPSSSTTDYSGNTVSQIIGASSSNSDTTQNIGGSTTDTTQVIGPSSTTGTQSTNPRVSGTTAGLITAGLGAVSALNTLTGGSGTGVLSSAANSVGNALTGGGLASNLSGTDANLVGAAPLSNSTVASLPAGNPLTAGDITDTSLGGTSGSAASTGVDTTLGGDSSAASVVSNAATTAPAPVASATSTGIDSLTSAQSSADSSAISTYDSEISALQAQDGGFTSGWGAEALSSETEADTSSLIAAMGGPTAVEDLGVTGLDALGADAGLSDTSGAALASSGADAIAADGTADAIADGAAADGGAAIASFAEEVAASWIVCTELYKQGRMPRRYYYYGAHVFGQYDEVTLKGYYYLAIPAVKHLRAYPESLLSTVLEKIFNSRAQYLSHKAGYSKAKWTLSGYCITHGMDYLGLILAHTVARNSPHTRENIHVSI